MLQSILNFIEHKGNTLPHPTLLFFWLCIAILLLSGLASLLNISAIHPATQETILAKNLLSRDGLHLILTKTVSNFINFAPVGSVLVAMIGIGIAESSGLLESAFKALVVKAPQKLLTAAVIFSGVLSSLAMDLGYVVLIPLAAIVFKSAGRHPIIGIAAAFAGVSGGFSANLFIGPVDVILAGLSQEAVQLVEKNAQVSVLGNYYFMIVSTFLITLIGTMVTEKIVAPRFSSAPLSSKKSISNTHSIDTLHRNEHNDSIEKSMSKLEKKGLIYVGIFTLIFTGIILTGLIPAEGFLRDPQTFSITRSPFIFGIVTVITAYLACTGWIFGKTTGKFKTSNNIVEAMEKNMQTMASYIILMFFAAQFVSYFNWSQLGGLLAINGANIITNAALPTPVILLLFIIFAAFINLFIGSSSAKWALLAPIFIPMLYLNGLSPEGTQLAFRIGDSVTNIITPLMPYFGVVVAFAQKYEKGIGIGTLITMMIPYSFFFLFFWSIACTLWVLLTLPIGPEVYFLQH